MAAAAAGSMLASAVLRVVTQKIGSSIGRQMQLHSKFSRDLEKMKMTLESVEAVLKDAERQSIKDAAVCLWLLRLKNVMYGISDMIDDFEDNTSTWSIILNKITMPDKIKKMNDQLKEIADQHHRFTLKEEISTNAQSCIDIRETSSTVEEALIIGRGDDKQKIISCLSGITQGIIILPIYGFAGIGKTTLAKLVFNDTQFKQYKRAWVYVSQSFDLNKIGNSILSQISADQSQMSGKQIIHYRLARQPPVGNTLIVLDDLWEKDSSQLEELMTMLKAGRGRKVVVIVTTRDEGIALKIRSSLDTYYKVEPLTNEICWDIIKHKSFFELRPDKQDLEPIGMDIAKKCGGVALAAQSLGYMLQSMGSDEWMSVRNSDVWSESISEDALSLHCVLASLKLTYISMSPCLKLCFAYCAIFTKGHNINKNDLIHQWISLGFIEPNNTFSSRQRGENYISQLLMMSFLQYSKPPVSKHDKDIIALTMHDLVHDLARSVMAGEVLDASKQRNIGGSSCRYALLTDCSKALNLSVIYPANIRTISFMDCGNTVLCADAFSSAKYLRVLDLSGCSIEKVPDSIGQLKQLRYLNAPRIRNKMIPKCITKLIKLNYLNLEHSYILSALPESIGQMEGLMHLNLSNCLGITVFPKSFAALKELIHLDLSYCSTSSVYLGEVLGGLTKLQYLSLAHCYTIGEIPTSLAKLKVLIHLDLSHCIYINGIPEAIGDLAKLQYVNLSYCNSLSKLPESFRQLRELLHLDLSRCGCVNGIPETLGSLTKLECLDLSYCRGLKGLPEIINNLTELRYLNLAGCLDYIFEGSPTRKINGFIDRQITTLSNLEHLDLSFNDKIPAIPESITSLKKLHTLDIACCYAIKELPSRVANMQSSHWM